MLNYIAALDYEHLDNGIFLTAVARSLAKQTGVRPVIVHGDSAYTERLIQTGMMRKDARLRCVKDLNNRLVGLFADQGVSTIAINGYQRAFIERRDGSLEIDKTYYDQLPIQPVLLLSNIIANRDNREQEVVPLDEYIDFLQSELQPDELFIFSGSESESPESFTEMASEISRKDLSSEFRNRYIPKEFHNFNTHFRLVTAEKFENVPDLTSMTLLK